MASCRFGKEGLTGCGDSFGGKVMTVSMAFFIGLFFVEFSLFYISVEA